MIEILKVVCWPIAVLGFLIFVCVFFRRHVAAFLDRTTSIGKDGLKASPPTRQVVQELDRTKQAHEIMEALTSPVIREREDAIRKELNEKGLEESSETVKVLTRPKTSVCRRA